MTRILLAIEEYSELIFLETLLKKVGFDVVGVQNDVVIAEKLVSFNPELLIMTAQGNRVNGQKALLRLKQKGSLPTTIFINPKGRSQMTQDKSVVATLDSPISPRTLIELISTIFELDEEVLLEKYEKASDFHAENEKDIRVKAQPAAAPETFVDSVVRFRQKTHEDGEKKKKRSQKYKKIAEATKLPAFLGFKKAQVTDQVKDFRKEEKEGLYKSIDEERIEFAKALSRKFKRK